MGVLITRASLLWGMRAPDFGKLPDGKRVTCQKPPGRPQFSQHTIYAHARLHVQILYVCKRLRMHIST